MHFARRMMAPSRLLAAFGLSLLFAGGPFGIRAADAQSVCNGGSSCTVVVSLQLDRPYVASLVLSQSVTSLPTLTSADFATGFRDQAGPQLRVKANAPYRVTIQAAVSTWQYSGTAAPPSKPSSDLLWSGSASGPWTSSASSATLWPLAATSAAATAGVTIPLFYRTLWSWTTSPPGAYTIPVNLTLTSP